mgnify:CR=1 FL=1|jgi:hypothetical protein
MPSHNFVQGAERSGFERAHSAWHAARRGEAHPLWCGTKGLGKRGDDKFCTGGHGGRRGRRERAGAGTRFHKPNVVDQFERLAAPRAPEHCHCTALLTHG